MQRRAFYLTLPSLLGLSLALALLGLLSQPTRHIASAAPLRANLTVTTTIQAAIDAAQPGDTIIIPAGTYTESLTLSKAVSLTGESTATTILSANPNDRVLTVTGASIDTTNIISGLTFANGNVTGDGGCLWIGNQAKPGLQNLVFTNCTTSWNGGGLYADGTSPLTLTNVSFSANTAAHGGGLAADSTMTLIGGSFENNSAAAAGGLTAVYLVLTGTRFVSNTAGSCGGAYVWKTATIADSYFERNHSTDPNYNGGGLFILNLYGAPNVLTMHNTVFVSNTSGLDGGGAAVGGNATMTGGRFENNEAHGLGGGLTVYGALTLSDTQFISNTALDGGGVYVSGVAKLFGAQFLANLAGRAGGGLAAYGFLTLTNMQFISNTAYGGGGAYAYATATVSDTQFLSNTASFAGGGAFANDDITLTGGLFQSNQVIGVGGSGGGLAVSSTFALTGTQFINNLASGDGGAICHYSYESSDARLVNTLFARNTAKDNGSAIYLASSGTVAILHTTIASPTAGAGAAIYVYTGTVNITNTIIASYTTGIQQAGGAVNSDYNLFFNAPTSVTIGSHSLIGLDPGFVDPQHDDYHLTANSLAIDSGIAAGVFTDLDGQPRPQGAGFDIGAYESPYTATFYKVHLPLIRR